MVLRLRWLHVTHSNFIMNCKEAFSKNVTFTAMFTHYIVINLIVSLSAYLDTYHFTPCFPLKWNLKSTHIQMLQKGRKTHAHLLMLWSLVEGHYHKTVDFWILDRGYFSSFYKIFIFSDRSVSNLDSQMWEYIILYMQWDALLQMMGYRVITAAQRLCIKLWFLPQEPLCI